MQFIIQCKVIISLILVQVLLTLLEGNLPFLKCQEQTYMFIHVSTRGSNIRGSLFKLMK